MRTPDDQDVTLLGLKNADPATEEVLFDLFFEIVPTHVALLTVEPKAYPLTILVEEDEEEGDAKTEYRLWPDGSLFILNSTEIV